MPVYISYMEIQETMSMVEVSGFHMGLEVNSGH